MMSKMVEAVRENRRDAMSGSITNFMGGESFSVNPIDTLKMVTASSIFGEPQYYRDGEFAESRIHDGRYHVNSLMKNYTIKELDRFEGMNTSDFMETIIDESLEKDFEATLRWAATLRTMYLMRLNPQVIMVRAAIHKKREKFTRNNPSMFSEINMQVMSRADDVISQLTYYLFINGSKSNIPSVLKRSWAKKMASLSRYELYKYRNHGLGLIGTIRICHAKGSNIDELMKTGTVAVEENRKTWESLRASGMDWMDITKQIEMPHMALLRNLRGIFAEVEDYKTCEDLLEQLKKGVIRGKQFPFRYMSASEAISKAEVHFKGTIKDGLEECLDISCENLPRLQGKNAFLSDNSGSAWGTCNSEYGSVTVAEIGNLSAVIGAANSDQGFVYTFGDTLIEHEISKRQGILEQAETISKEDRNTIGMQTECGIWLFFDRIIRNEEKFDNIFIYSDMQAGHGGLYGTREECVKYAAQGYSTRGLYINVPMLIETYRRKVNPKVNVFCIQTAGYDNVLVPEYAYRCNILYGWTGKELLFADAMNRFWDEKDKELLSHEGTETAIWN